LPVLPVVLASALGTSRWRPLGVVMGLVLSFAFFTLALTALVSSFGISADALRLAGALVIGLFGLVLVVPALQHRFEILSGRFAGLGRTGGVGGGYWSGALVGASLGLVWAPCAGPILAAVTTLVATNRISAGAVAVTLAYAVGAGMPMLGIAYGGRRAVGRVRALSRHTGTLQRVFGVVMVAFALSFFAGIDRTLQAALVQGVPTEWTNTLTALEDQPGIREALSTLKGKSGATQPMAATSEGSAALAAPAIGATADLPDLGPTAQLEGIVGWINGEPVTLAALRGKVVLVDFWTYSCINCVRTLPYLNQWHEKYGQEGLVILGVHTPEFAFEKSRDNVARATEQYGIKYLVALDNDYATWEAYDNRYWPAKYLIDAKGRVRYRHFGEGKYQESEAAIRALLAEAGMAAVADDGGMPTYALAQGRTPEIYLGAARQRQLHSPERVLSGQRQHFSPPAALPLHRFAFEGEWMVEKEYATAGAGTRLELQFRADDVYLVLGPAEAGEQIEVTLDGVAVDETMAGADVHAGILSATEPRVYHVVDLRGDPGEHRLGLRFQTGGTRVYTFTFG
jgi:cytochrome c biogenesis protein CcdA/thiol-disulfide isomerase/thioredoxin